MVDETNFLGDLAVTPSFKNPGWYEISGPPRFGERDRHIVAYVDTQIGAVGTALGMNFLSARMERDATKEAIALEAMDFFFSQLR